MGAAAFATLTSTALGAEPAWKLKPGEWTSVKVDLRGPKVVVKIGEVATTFEHTSLARAKTNLSIGFFFWHGERGELAGDEMSWCAPPGHSRHSRYLPS